MERWIKYLIRISTGRDISFHHSSPGREPYLIQIPSRAFSHRSSSHVIYPNEDFGNRKDPAYIRSDGIHFMGRVLKEALAENSKRFILTCTHNYVRAFALGGRGGCRAHYPKRNGFTVRRVCRFATRPNICLVLYMSDLNFDNLPVWVQFPGNNPYRSDTSRRTLKTAARAGRGNLEARYATRGLSL